MATCQTCRNEMPEEDWHIISKMWRLVPESTRLRLGVTLRITYISPGRGELRDLTCLRCVTHRAEALAKRAQEERARDVETEVRYILRRLEELANAQPTSSRSRS